MKNKKVSASDFGITMSKRTPSDISEDNHLRSRYMWHLIHDSDSSFSQNITVVIPRILVQFWDDIKTMPADVRKCIDSWRPLDVHNMGQTEPPFRSLRATCPVFLSHGSGSRATWSFACKM